MATYTHWGTAALLGGRRRRRQQPRKGRRRRRRLWRCLHLSPPRLKSPDISDGGGPAAAEPLATRKFRFAVPCMTELRCISAITGIKAMKHDALNPRFPKLARLRSEPWPMDNRHRGPRPPRALAPCMAALRGGGTGGGTLNLPTWARGGHGPRLGAATAGCRRPVDDLPGLGRQRRSQPFTQSAPPLIRAPAGPPLAAPDQPKLN